MAVIDKTKTNPTFDGINLMVMNSTADSVTQSLSDLLEAGFVGALLSMVVLYLFLRNLTTTLIVVLSMPCSICITLGCMYFMGYSINILSLMGLMLAIGMLVDNAVVVTESISQEKANNANSSDAIITGVGKVSLAVIAGTATTAIVFLPNIIGEKIDVTIFLETRRDCHLYFLVCLTVNKQYKSLYSSKLPTRAQTKTEKNTIENKAKRLYRKLLVWMLLNQGKTGGIALLLLLSAAIPISFVSQNDEGNNQKDRIWMNYHVKGNYSLEEVELSVNQVEERTLYANQQKFHIERVYSYYTPGFATSMLTLKKELPSLPVSELKKQIKQSMPKMAMVAPSLIGIQAMAAAVKIQTIWTIVRTIVRHCSAAWSVLEKVDGLTDVRPEQPKNKFELQILVDREKAHRFGLSQQANCRHGRHFAKRQ